MRNFTISIVLLLVMASFTTNLTNNTTKVLTDIEGTLLETSPIMENNNGDFTVTFTVDESVIVTSALIGSSNEIFLMENGNSDQSKTVTLGLQSVDGKVETAFNNIYDSNYDVSTMDALLNKQDPDRRPKGIIIWE